MATKKKLNGVAAAGGKVADTEKKKKLNGVAVILDGISFDQIGSAAPQVSEGPMEHSLAEGSHVGQEVLGLEDSGNQSSDSVCLEKSRKSPPNRLGRPNRTVPQPFELATEKRASGVSRRAEGDNKTETPRNPAQPDEKKQEAEDDNVSVASSAFASARSVRSSKSNTTPVTSPVPRFSERAEKLIELSSPKKAIQSSETKYPEDDDNSSVASSTAASSRSFRSIRPYKTIASAPTFRSSERAEKRKEYYSKLEERQQALEAERLQFEARLKAEEEAAIKQMRKNLVFKANPVPSFYYDDPPPKPEIKKLPLTRPKSPRLSHRRSSSDSLNSSGEDRKIVNRALRHSLSSIGHKENPASCPKPTNSRAARADNVSLDIQD